MPKHVVHPASDRAGVVSSTEASALPVVCFSHLRWDFVYQRPQHLMSRFARERRVYFVEEPVSYDGPPRLDVRLSAGDLRVVVPYVPRGFAPHAVEPTLRRLVADMFVSEHITAFIAWYYTPMAFAWAQHLHPDVVIYDCMDELSLFRGAPAEMVERERHLLQCADIVFTGGTSLYEAKRDRHPNVHCFSSSIDRDHFLPARTRMMDPADQASIPHPRLGFAGVIDERMDIALLDAIAVAHPEWQLVLVGPVVKIDPGHLPCRSNIHYVGGKAYGELPAYMAGWDVALMPFAMNESTRFISPTKTPEYLAAGRPVVSTPIRDVVNPYGTAELVQIAHTPSEFCAAIERALALQGEERRQWLTRVDGFLSTVSWNGTHARMTRLIDALVAERQETSLSTPEHRLPTRPRVTADYGSAFSV
jgi:UDP-galactopyranose mutase